MTKWYRDEWWSVANIVATDFFLGNNIIEESIRSNRRRSKDCQRNQIIGSNLLPTFDQFTTQASNVITEKQKEVEDDDLNQNSSWLSWFGF